MLLLVMNRKRRLLTGLSSNPTQKIARSILRKEIFKKRDARYFDLIVMFQNANEEKLFRDREVGEPGALYLF